jgi:hypothetical protein
MIMYIKQHNKITQPTGINPMCKNCNNYFWVFNGLNVSKGLILRNASPIHYSSCPSPSTLTSTTLMDDAIKVWALEKLKDANKSSSTWRFTLFNFASMSLVFEPFFLEPYS